MMGINKLDRQRVIERSESLPSFPRTVCEILATIDDPDGNLKVLVDCINHDPLIAARVLSAANRAATRARRDTEITDIYTATSLIGMSRVREIALIGSMKNLVAGILPGDRGSRMWQHSVAVGVCCEEIVLHIVQPISIDSGLIAGLLHDIGQFWLYAMEPDAFQICRNEAIQRDEGIEQLEQEHFGVPHSTIGFWLAEHWGLPEDICTAIAGHHAPDNIGNSLLIPLVHVAEVLSNALELTGGDFNRVTYVSSLACKRLGLVWNEDCQTLFGRIAARTQYANAFFGP